MTPRTDRTQVAHGKGGAAFAQFDYTLDSVSNRLSKLSTLNSQPSTTESCQYDPTDQIANVDYGTGRTTGFQRDATGNRTSVADSASVVPASYTANSMNQVHRRRCRRPHPRRQWQPDRLR